jgi:hypothetical protein
MVGSASDLGGGTARLRIYAAARANPERRVVLFAPGPPANEGANALCSHYLQAAKVKILIRIVSGM